MKKYYLNVIFVITVVSSSLLHAAAFDATVQFAKRAELSVPVSGQIKHVNVTAGQQVEPDFVMIALDKTPFEAAVAHASANVTSKTTLEQEASRDLAQAQELYDRGVLSTVELENAKNLHIRAQADLQAAQASLTRAQYDLTHTEILAPSSGWVLKVKAAANESINSELGLQPLVIFAEAGKYKARANVPLKTLRALKVGQAGKVTVLNKVFKATLSSLGFEPSASGKDSYEIEFIFDTNNVLLQAGQAAKVEF